MVALLGEQEVLTVVVRPPADKVPRGGIDHPGWFDSRFRRALNLRIVMKSDALINASYSDRSSPLRMPSFARSASTATLSWTCAATRNSATRRADSASRHRLNGSNRLSSTHETNML